MNSELFKQQLNEFSDENYQAILNGASLVIFEDKSLTLGRSEQAFVIFELGDEAFDSTEALKLSLIDRADALIVEYYEHNPLSKQFFNTELAKLVKEHGYENFVSMPSTTPSIKLFVNDGKVLVEGRDSPRFKYGFHLHLTEKMMPQAVENKVKNWVQSGSAYDDYISVNVCRFSSTDLENTNADEYA